MHVGVNQWGGQLGGEAESWLGSWELKLKGFPKVAEAGSKNIAWVDTRGQRHRHKGFDAESFISETFSSCLVPVAGEIGCIEKVDHRREKTAVRLAIRQNAFPVHSPKLANNALGLVFVCSIRRWR